MINSVLKAIRIMQLFSASEPALSLAEISARLGMPKSTAHNLLNTLLSEGFIEKVNRDQYALGTALIPLTQSIRVNVELRDRAAPLLRRLADESRESVYLTVREGDRALYIYAVESSKRLLARTAVGDRAPLHCTAVGKAILAYLPDDDVAAMLRRAPLAAFTPATITAVDALTEELARTRERGYAIDRQEHERSTFCLGAPILDGRGRALGACSVSGADSSIVGVRVDELSARVRQVAEEISRRMGFVPATISRVNALQW
jgi:IclR family transcriptional regulator, acetate operon repressor